MKNYGKIVIMADSIEQAQAELDTIKALVGMGATCGMGEVEITEEIVVEMPRVNGIMADRMAETYAENCACRGGNCIPCCCCCCEDDEDEDEYGDENFEMESDPITRAMMRMMGM